MLSMSGGVSAGQCTTYHEQADYYTQHGGEWLGKGAEELGLSGTVDKADFRAIAAGLDPRDPSRVLVEAKPRLNKETGKMEEKRRAGNDLSFSAPKSMSILWAAGDDKMREVHETGVKEVMAFLEANYSMYRVADGKGGKGKLRVQADNILAAMFTHGTNREGEPDLHSHVVLMNIIRDIYGEHRANDPKLIYQLQKALGRQYRAIVIHELRKEGYQVEITDRNELYFEIKGVDKSLIKNLSSRRNAIEKKVEEWKKEGRYEGKREAEIFDLATAATKKAKVKSSHAEVKAGFVEQFKENGTSAAGIRAAVEKEKVSVNEIPLPSNQVAAQKAEKGRAIEASLKQAIEVLHETQSVFTQIQVLDIAQKLDAGDHGLADLAKGFTALQRKSDVVSLGQDRQQEVYSSKEMIKLEQSNLDRVKDFAGKFKSQTTEKEVSSFIDKWEIGKAAELKIESFKLSEGQRKAMITELCSSNGILNIQGDPGTGKTTFREVVDAFHREVLEQSGRGHYVLGAGYTGTAAKELGTAMNRTANTIDKYLNQQIKAVDPKKYAQIVKAQDEAQKAKNQSADNMPARGEGKKAKVISQRRRATLTGGSIITKKMSDGTKQKTRNMIAAGVRTNVTEMYNKEGKLTGTRKTNPRGDSKYFGADGNLKSTTSRQGFLGGDNKATTVYEDGRVKDTLTTFTAGVKKESNQWTMQDGSKSVDGKFRDAEGKIISDSNITFVPKGHNIMQLVDEFSFVGAKQEKLLLDKAEKLSQELGVSVKYGRMQDGKQYTAISAGSPGENSIDNSGADLVRLKEINRQDNADLLDVVKKFNVDDKSLRGASAQEGYDKLKGMGFVIECKSSELVGKSIDLRFEHGEQPITYTDVKGKEKTTLLKDMPILTGTNKVCDEINQKVRARLQAAGELKDERAVDTLKSAGLSATQMGIATNYKAGDTITFNGYRDAGGNMRNYSDIANGSFTTILGSDSTKNTVTIAIGDKAGNRPYREIKVTDIMNKVSISKGSTKNFAIGDNIICLQNDKKLGVTNGTQLKVCGFDKDGGVIAQYPAGKDGKPGEKIKLGGYLQIDHAYAITPQKSQGATMPAPINCNMPQDKITHNGVNVIISRGKAAAFVVTSDVKKYREQIAILEDKRDTVGKGGQRKLEAALKKEPKVAQVKGAAKKSPEVVKEARQSLSVEQLQEKQQIAKEQNEIRRSGGTKSDKTISSKPQDLGKSENLPEAVAVSKPEQARAAAADFVKVGTDIAKAGVDTLAGAATKGFADIASSMAGENFFGKNDPTSKEASAKFEELGNKITDTVSELFGNTRNKTQQVAQEQANGESAKQEGVKQEQEGENVEGGGENRKAERDLEFSK